MKLKKLKEKKVCKETDCEEGASKAKAKGGFVPGKPGVNPFPKKK